MINQLDTLKPAELDLLEQAVRERRAVTDEARKKKAFHQTLLASGLVKRIARQTEPDISERHLIEMQGEAVSETILRERC